MRFITTTTLTLALRYLFYQISQPGCLEKVLWLVELNYLTNPHVHHIYKNTALFGFLRYRRSQWNLPFKFLEIVQQFFFLSQHTFTKSRALEWEYLTYAKMVETPPFLAPTFQRFYCFFLHTLKPWAIRDAGSLSELQSGRISMTLFSCTQIWGVLRLTLLLAGWLDFPRES